MQKMSDVLFPLHMTLKDNSHCTDKRQQTHLLGFVESVCYPFAVCCHWSEFVFTRLNMFNQCLLVSVGAV